MSYFYGQNLHLPDDHPERSRTAFSQIRMIPPRIEDGAQFSVRGYQGSLSLVSPAYSWSVDPIYSIHGQRLPVPDDVTSDSVIDNLGHAEGQDARCRKRRLPTIAQRRAANVRERRRMFNLNEAFDCLRRRVPTFAYEKRLSRIETLRLAIAYIGFMTDIVNGKSPDDIKMNVYRSPLSYENGRRQTNNFQSEKEFRMDSADESIADDSGHSNGRDTLSEYDSNGEDVETVQ